MNKEQYLELLEKEYINNYLEADNIYSFIANEVYDIYTHNDNYDKNIALQGIQVIETLLGQRSFKYWQDINEVSAYILLASRLWLPIEWEQDISEAYFDYNGPTELEIGDTIFDLFNQEEVTNFMEALKILVEQAYKYERD